MKWWQGGLAALDTETTGLEIETARVVQIALATIRPAAPRLENRVKIRTQLIDPGVEMPAAAAAVHGLTTELLQAKGRAPAETLDVFIGDIALALVRGLPLVVMNAVYDLTILDREARRHRLPTLEERLDGRPLAPVIDPLVIDIQLVPKRRRVSPTQGPRQLKTLCEVWGVGWDDGLAHAAEYDALQAARLVWRLCQEYPDGLPGGLTPMELHDRQVGWRAEQQRDFGAWLRSQGKQADVDEAWPIRPYRPASTVQEAMPV